MRSRLSTLTMLATAGLSAGALSVAALGAATRPAIVLGKPTELAITAPASVKAGTVSFAVRNGGKAKHEIEIIRTAKRASSLPVKGGKAVAPDELKEIENIQPGATRTLAVKLTRGHYILICNLPGHYQGGMRRDLNVT